MEHIRFRLYYCILRAMLFLLTLTFPCTIALKMTVDYENPVPVFIGDNDMVVDGGGATQVKEIDLDPFEENYPWSEYMTHNRSEVDILKDVLKLAFKRHKVSVAKIVDTLGPNLTKLKDNVTKKIGELPSRKFGQGSPLDRTLRENRMNLIEDKHPKKRGRRRVDAKGERIQSSPSETKTESGEEQMQKWLTEVMEPFAPHHFYYSLRNASFKNLVNSVSDPHKLKKELRSLFNLSEETPLFPANLSYSRSSSDSSGIKTNLFLNRQRRSAHSIRGQDHKGAIMYLPVGGQDAADCPDAIDAAAVSISQLTFLSLALGVFSAVANIASNINNNNNNNNNNNDNNINTNNLNFVANANSGNEIEVQIPPPIPGKRALEFKRRRRDLLRLKELYENMKRKQIQGNMKYRSYQNK